MRPLSEAFIPVDQSTFKKYLFDSKGMPRIDPSKLEAQLLEGDQRDQCLMPITGDASMYLNYKRRPGVVASYGLNGDDLRVLQLQGATGSRSEGYRLNTGMLWVDFFADQTVELARRTGGLRRITMPAVGAIEGLISGAESAIRRYEIFAKKLHMAFSKEEKLHVRDL